MVATSRDGIYTQVLKKISPSAEKRESMESTAREIIGRAGDWLAENGVEAEVVEVGSAARSTWLVDSNDIDIFIIHPLETSIEEMEGNVESIAMELAGEYEKRYAQHPYATFRYNDFDVDLVPCYPYDPESGIRSAVDRTPAHNVYVLAGLKGREDDVLILKQFLTARGIYGSELRTQGFSGYLCELLIINYEGFDSLLKAARGWTHGAILNPKNHFEYASFDDPLVVIDPTDSNRNVAAALSEENMYRFVEACRDFDDSPGIEAFFPLPPPEMDAGEFNSILTNRGMHLLGVMLEAPAVVEDVLYPQLRRSLAGARALLERNEFVVHRDGAFANGGVALLLFELSVWELPPIRCHAGPPVEEEEHARRFREKHPQAYISDSRYFAEVPREHVNAGDLLNSELASAAHGTQVREALEGGFDVLSGAELWSACGGVIRRHLAGFFQPFRAKKP